MTHPQQYPQQPPYQPVYGQAPVIAVPPPPNSGLAVTAMVLGIVGLVLVVCTAGLMAPLTLILSALAVVFGHIAVPQISRTGARGRGMAVAGLVTGYIGVAPAIFFIVVLIAGAAGSSTAP